MAIESFLEHDLERRVPGNSVSTDAMYRLPLRTNDPEEGCIVFAVGEHGDICRWWVLQSEAHSHLKRAYEQWIPRLKQQTFQDPVTGACTSAFDAIKYWDTDTCCSGGDPKGNFLFSLFPSLVSVRKDPFHAVQLVTESLGNPIHKDAVGKEFGAIIRQPVENDLIPGRDHLRSKASCKGLSDAALRSKVLSSYPQSVRRISRARDVVAQELEAAGDRWEAIRQTWLDAPKGERGDPPAFRGELSKRSPATRHVINNMITCVRKGCYEDHRPVEEGYFLLRTGQKTKIPVYKCKNGTGKNEALHRPLNQLVVSVSRVLGQRLHKRISLRVHKYSTDQDAQNGFRPQRPSHPLWQLARLQQHGDGFVENFSQSSYSANLSSAAKPAEYHGFNFSAATAAEKLGSARDAAASLDAAHILAGETDAAAGGGGMLSLPLASASASAQKSTSGQATRRATRARSSSSDSSKDESGAAPAEPPPNRSSKLPKAKKQSVSTERLSRPNGEEEVQFAIRCLAAAQAQGASHADPLTAAALAYNTGFFKTSLDPSQPAFPKAPTNALMMKEAIDRIAPQNSLKRPLHGSGGESQGSPSSSLEAAASAS